MSSEPRDALVIRAEQTYRDATADPRRGRVAAQRLVAEARRHRAAEALVVALRAQAFAAREVYDHGEARRCIDEAIRVARHDDLRPRLAETLVTRAAIHLEMGRSNAAARDLSAAAEAAEGVVRVEVDFATGLHHDTTGDFDAAVRAYRRVLDGPTARRPDLRFKALNNLGLVLLRLARYDEAERVLADALALAETFSPMYVGYAAESRATAAIERGAPIEAMRRYAHAETVLRTTGVQLVDLYLGKAQALLNLRLLDEAAAVAQQAVDEVEGRDGGQLMLAECLLIQARVHLAQEALAEATAAAGRAEQLFRVQRREGWRARAALTHSTTEWRRGATSATLLRRLGSIEQTMHRLGNVPGVTEAALLHGEVAAALGRRARALAAFERASETGRGPILLRLRGRLAAARRAEMLGDIRRLSSVCRRGLSELAEYRAALGSAELRARAAAHGSALADIGLRAAVQGRRAERAWVWMERARTLVAVREGTVEIDDTVLPDVAELRALERDLAELAPDETIDQRDLLRRIAQTERRIRNRTWVQRSTGVVATVPSVATMRALRGALEDRALLQYAVLDGRIVGVAITPRAARLTDLAALDEIDGAGRQLAFALRRLARPRSGAGVHAAHASARHELARLSALLVDPFARLLQGTDAVVVVPPAELIGVPWGALDALSEKAPRVVPSATLWRRSHERVSPGGDVVLVAGPGLPGAPSEVAAIASHYDQPRTMVGSAATIEAVRAHISGAHLVHLACHGRLRRDTAAFSSLQLADGPLTVYDLERLNTPAHHWVLAACDLGSPGQLIGPELDGVLSTLLHGGAAGVVAAVVSIPDLATVHAMTDLHEALAAGDDLAEAVRGMRERVDPTEPESFVASVAFTCYGGG